ncbi:MAG: type II toxin-antitoxin system RelE/ParE family toxin [Clostridiales bacterium]|nr:type II toxin-antitoxin system RelE/ParE family toxin [Clostridiales bacterium]
MRIRYTPQAQTDLREVRDYISNVLKNPVAAKNVTGRIIRSCHKLSDQPNMGASLQGKTGRNTDYRYLICENHIAFYEVQLDCVCIIRIPDGRTDYMWTLFSGN